MVTSSRQSWRIALNPFHLAPGVTGAQLGHENSHKTINEITCLTHGNTYLCLNMAFPKAPTASHSPNRISPSTIGTQYPVWRFKESIHRYYGYPMP